MKNAARAAVVGGENDQGVLVQAGLRKGGEDAADAVVEVLNEGDVFRPLLVHPRGALDDPGKPLRRRFDGEMRRVVGQVEEERLVFVLRAPAEELFAEEIAALVQDDHYEKPPGWRMSARAVHTYICGGKAGKRPITAKYIGHERLVEIAIATLVTDRALLLIGEPGTAKSWLSEHLAAAINGDSTKVVQGTAGTTEEHIRYTWNYAMLIAQGPSREALIKSPIFRAMESGTLARFEEITRCASEVQDAMISLLSEKRISVPELETEVAAKRGFSVIATANTRDRGVNEMSAALKRRFDFETVFPILDYDQELALVEEASAKLLARSNIPRTVPAPVLELLVSTFRDLRGGPGGAGGAAMDRLNAVMSTAEAVNVAHAVGVRAWFLEQRDGTPADLVDCIAGTVVKDDADDRAKLRRYFEQKVAGRAGGHWRAYFEARNRLP